MRLEGAVGRTIAGNGPLQRINGSAFTRGRIRGADPDVAFLIASRANPGRPRSDSPGENDKVIEALLLNRLREFLRVNALSDIVECCEALRGLI